VRVSQADNLPGVTGIGENFLISGEAGIENDFAAPARDGAGRAAIKYAPVFQRECGGSVLNFGQCVFLRQGSSKSCRSFGLGFRGGERTEMVDGPIGKNGAAVDVAAGHGSKHAGIVGADAVITHYEIAVAGDANGAKVA
jgi:hypothetical protein